MKVMHDCRQNAAALQIQADIHLKTIFDTQARPVTACLPVCAHSVCVSVQKELKERERKERKEVRKESCLCTLRLSLQS